MKNKPKNNTVFALTAIVGLMVCTPVWADYQATVLADHPVGYWPLDLTVDTNIDSTTGDYIAADLSGNGNYGDYISISPGQLTAGPSAYIPYGATFDGSSAYVDLSVGSNTARLNFGGRITMEAWVQTTFDTLYNLSYIQQSVIAKGEDFSQGTNCTEMGGNYWGNYDGGSYSPSTGIQGQMDDAQFGGNDDGGGDPVVPDSGWHYEVCTYDGTHWNFYLDGVLQNATPGTAGAIDSTTPWAIGTGTADGLANLFPGNICQVALYTNALTLAQVRAHYLAGNYGSPTPPPAILTQPTSHKVYPTGSVTFSLLLDVATGPFGYQWYRGTAPISEQTNAVLTLTNVQSTDSTNYTVVVNNSSGAVTSSVVTLTVLAAPAANSYAGNVLADKPATYWRLNDANGTTMYDSIHGFDGSAVGTVAAATDSPLIDGSGQAMNFDGGGRIALPYSPLFNTTDAFSYEVWYNEDPGSSGIRCPLWFRDEPVLGDTRGWVHYLEDNVDPVTKGRGNVFQSSDVFTTWNGLGSGTLFAQGEWQHLVCTFDGQHKQIFLDGVLISISTTAVLEVKPVQRAVETISSSSYPFLGSLEEVAIYPNALPADRIVAHWLAARGTNPPAIAATFVVPPLGATNYVGSTITIPVLVVGTAPFTYQWYEGTNLLSGQTNATLTILNATPAAAGSYTVVVNNSGGSVTSPAADVELLSAPPSIVQQPQSATRLQGASVTFTVQAGGSLPLYFQWLSNSVPIAGATSTNLTLNNIQPSFAASYSLIVSNGLTHATIPSQPADLTVVPAAPGGYAATVVRDMPLAYWRLDETKGTNAYDLVGGNTGTYDPGVTFGVPGAILGDSDLAAEFPGNAGITVPHNDELNPFAAFSVELWARPDPSGAGLERALFASRASGSGWYFGYYLSANSSDQWQFNTGQKTSGIGTLTGGATTNQAWYHIVATFDATTGSKKLYVNGQLAANTTAAVGTFAPNNSEAIATGGTATISDEGIGNTTASDPAGAGTYFYGDLDEVAVYGYALSPEQVAQHYAVATSPTLGIARAGNKVVITWSQGLLLQANAVTGPWTTNTTAVSPWTNAPVVGPQFFRAYVP